MVALVAALLGLALEGGAAGDEQREIEPSDDEQRRNEGAVVVACHLAPLYAR